jgi:hypothetical protein
MRSVMILKRITRIVLDHIFSRPSMRLVLAVILLLCVSTLRAKGEQTQPNTEQTEVTKFFREYAGLKDDEIKSIQSGKAIAKDVKSPSEQVLIFGAVFVKANPESYLAFATDIQATSKLPGYLAIRQFSDPPQLSDLDGFTLEPGDIKDLEKCKPDDCEIQLPAKNIEEFQSQVNWKAADVTKEVNDLAQKMALSALQSYIQGGNAALGTYRDKKSPHIVAETFEALLAHSKALPVYLPDLHRYLLEYPTFKSPDIHSEFHWEKVKFGLKPTLRIIQRVIYKGAGASGPIYALAEKQLYSSHYFQSAIDITVAVKDTPAANQVGFYLITAKASQQTFKGGIVRNVAVGKARSSLEQGLQMIKQKLEQPK